MDITEYWKTIIGITLGLSLLVFGLAFWNSATADDYTSHLNDKTYTIESCQQYMDFGLISDRDKCLQKREIGGTFIGSGILVLWATIYLNKDYLEKIMKDNNML